MLLVYGALEPELYRVTAKKLARLVPTAKTKVWRSGVHVLFNVPEALEDAAEWMRQRLIEKGGPSLPLGEGDHTDLPNSFAACERFAMSCTRSVWTDAYGPEHVDGSQSRVFGIGCSHPMKRMTIMQWHNAALSHDTRLIPLKAPASEGFILPCICGLP